MISKFIGAFTKGTIPLPQYQFSAKTQDFCFSSSEKIFETSHGIGCLHGQLFSQNFKEDPIGFFSRLSNVLKGSTEEIDDFHQSLDGTYFLIYFDKEKKKLFLFNNRYQTTSCYYKKNKQNNLFFSNNLFDLVDLMKSEGEVPIIHKGSVKSFLLNGFTMPDQTQIADYYKLLPCFQLTHTEDKSHLKSYADKEYFFQRKPIGNVEESINQYEKIYQTGISHFLNETKPNELGTLLSGGHDTSFTLIQASKVFSKPLHAFTVTFPGWAWDESSYAQNIAQKFGAKFHPIPFGPEDLDYIVSMVHGNQEPVVGSSLPLHKLSLEAANHVDALMGGDGGDTLWGEYYPVAEYHRIVKNLPSNFRKFFYHVAKSLRKITDWERFWELEHVSELFSKPSPYDDFMRRLCTYRHFSGDYLDELLNEEFKKSSLPLPAYQVPFTKENFQEALIYGKLYNAFYTYQSFSTYRSVEHFGTPFYLPTINKDLIRFIGELPDSWINGGTAFHRLTNNKTINRRFHKLALSKYLKREEIYNRSFDIPWYKILKPRKEVLNKLLIRLKDRNWFREESLDKLFMEFHQQPVKDYELLELKHHGYRIFTLLSLEVWATEMLQRRTVNPDRKIPLEDYL